MVWMYLYGKFNGNAADGFVGSLTDYSLFRFQAQMVPNLATVIGPERRRWAVSNWPGAAETQTWLGLGMTWYWQCHEGWLMGALLRSSDHYVQYASPGHNDGRWSGFGHRRVPGCPGRKEHLRGSFQRASSRRRRW